MSPILRKIPDKIFKKRQRRRLVKRFVLLGKGFNNTTYRGIYDVRVLYVYSKINKRVGLGKVGL